MKRFSLVIVALCAAAAASAQPKVAVLDAELQKGIERSASTAVAEKLIERLVMSGRYTVLDRTNVEKVLREREFQLSGLVSDSEISEAGKYLGADFVVVIRVQRVDRTYLVSAKMIAVSTGVIARQSSAEGEGKSAVLLQLAEEAGDALAGVARKPPVATAARKSTSPRQDPGNGVGVRLYAGVGGGGQDFSDYLGRYGPYSSGGFDLYAMAGLWKGLCFVGNLTYLDAYADYGAATLSLDAGLGYAYPLGILLPWAAFKVGYVFLEWPDYYEYARYSDLQYSIDLGIDARLGRFLLGGRLQLSLSSFSDSGGYDLSMLEDSFWLMLGWRL